MALDYYPFLAAEGRHDTWVVTDGFCNLIDCIPTLTAAETVAAAMNGAYHRGYEAARADFRAALGVIP
jgi:hypothetical protein